MFFHKKLEDGTTFLIDGPNVFEVARGQVAGLVPAEPEVTRDVFGEILLSRYLSSHPESQDLPRQVILERALVWTEGKLRIQTTAA